MDVLPSRRTAAINLASAPSPAQCHHCGSRHIGMCDSLADDDLAFLARAAQRMTVSPGKPFIEETQPADHFYNINAGTVRVFKSLPDGRRHIIGFMGLGQFLGLGSGGRFAFSAEAMDGVELCRFHRKSLTEIFDDFPALERRLLNIASHELTMAHEHMLLLARKTALERVASFIMSWAERSQGCTAGGKPPPGMSIALPMTRGDLGDYLGLTIETVSRSLNDMKRQGLIGLDDTHAIRLLKPGRLADIAAASGE